MCLAVTMLALGIGGADLTLIWVQEIRRRLCILLEMHLSNVWSKNVVIALISLFWNLCLSFFSSPDSVCLTQKSMWEWLLLASHL